MKHHGVMERPPVDERTEDQILEDMIAAEGSQEEVSVMPEPELEHPADLPEPEPELEPAVTVVASGTENLAALIQSLQDEIAKLKTAPKNQVPGKPGDKVYIRIGEFSGKAPRQQQNLAAILTFEMPLGEKFTESQVFEILNKHVESYESLRTSLQDVTYLFRYYRGLKPTGFTSRDFLRVT